MSKLLTAAIGALLMAYAAPPALGETWPSRPIRVIVPFAAGGSTDITTRVVAENLRPVLGQIVVVDNRPGANATIGADIVAKAPPNGYTFLIGGATHVANMSLYRNLPYDFMADLTPVVQTHSSNNVLVVNPKVPVGNLPEFIAHVKSGKSKVTYGSGGHGTSQHLAAALFNHMVGANMLHVPYKGGAPAMIDLVGGSIDSIFSPLIEALPFIKSGVIKPLAVCGVKRSPLLPAVPPLADLLPGYQSTTWSGFMAPARTPPAIVNTMNAAVMKVLNQPNVRAHFAEADKEIAGGSPADFKKFIAADAERLRAQVKISGAKAE